MNTSPIPIPGPQEWTRNDIYQNPHPTLPMPPFMTPFNRIPEVAAGLWTEKLRTAEAQEEEWVWMDDFRGLTPEEEALMINDGTECQVCSQKRHLLRYRGMTTGLVFRMELPHGCKRIAHLSQLWRNLTPPKRFREVRLAGLEPSRLSMLPTKKQADIIATLKQHPDCSYLLAGDTRTGKSHLMYGLLFHAVERWSFAREDDPLKFEPSVFLVDTPKLLEDISQFKFHRLDDPPTVDPPQVMADQVKRLVKEGYRVWLGLDELEKVTPTEPRMNNLFELVNQVSLGRGQIVATSNITLAALRKKWAGFSAGDAILSRIISQDENGRYLEFLQSPPNTKK